MARPAPSPALVVGCGVIGLTSALELQAAGVEVTIAARELPPATVSDVAAAFWYPYAVLPPERCLPWAMESLGVFREHALDPASGVVLCRGIELVPPGGRQPAWLLSLPGARPARPEELRPGFPAGIVFEAPLVETSLYLPWLMARFRARGGRIETADFAGLEQALSRSPLVIDCAGLGARELARDPSVFPIRGQILRVARGAQGTFAVSHGLDGGATYVIPRSHDCVLGGTRGDGVDSLAPDPAESADILRRTAELAPAVLGAEVFGLLVGLRPGRPSVRLEVERLPAGRVIHNYGHGGAGVTLSWGCAREVRRLAL
jgi:D-amino-acid oxidase